MTKKSDKSSEAPDSQLLVYGLDDAGKPKGARFAASDSEKVLPVAKAMSLQYRQDCSEEVAAIGAKLPPGRIYARGKAFIPNIKRDLYDKLLAALASGAPPKVEQTASNNTALEANGDIGDASMASPPILPPLASGLPQNWESIAAGNMILVDAGPGEGWWEAIVTSRDSEILTLRYRDYPKVPKFERHVSTVALINPRPA